MTYRGRIQGGVVVLEPPAELPEGTEVEVEPTERPTIQDVLQEFSGTMTGNDLPADGSLNHDHYVYGAPKR